MAEFNGRNQAKRVAATTTGHGSAAAGGDMGDGEEIGGVGSRHTATLNERANKSLNRNAGPSRPSANTGKVSTPGMGSRKTGRV